MLMILRKICPVCQTQALPDDRFCMTCGHAYTPEELPVEVPDPHPENGPKMPNPKVFGLLAFKKDGRFSERAKRWFRSFKGAFRKRSNETKDDSIETHLFHPERMTPDEPFMFVRIILFFLILFGCAILASDVTLTVLSLSLIAPFSLLWYYYERHLPRTVNGIDVLRYFLFGGLVSIIVVYLIRAFVGYPGIPLFGDVLTGLVEEAAKIAVVLFIIRKKGIKDILTGMLVGFAVGAGFDVFETASYGISELLEYDDYFAMLGVIAMRSGYSLVGIGHHFWTAMIAGAVIYVNPNGYYKLGYAFRPTSMVWYFLVALIHGLFNFLSGIGFGWTMIPVSLILFLLMWRNASIRVRPAATAPEEAIPFAADEAPISEETTGQQVEA